MKILPTLNIQNGLVVPLSGQGGATGDVMGMVTWLMDQGCHRLGLVDVDAARGHGNNRELIARAVNRFHAGRQKVLIQVGGGIRSSDQAQFFLDHGATWLAVGTILHRSPVMVEQLLARFREHLTAAVDVRGGEILASGWGGTWGQKPDAAGGLIGRFGFKRVLFMDLSPDAPEPDFETARLLSLQSKVPVFMGGSIRAPRHLTQAKEIPGLQGVVLDGLLLRDDPAFSVSNIVPGC
ncbi:HisA/HisF-related TIM barrel protein [Mesoterricola sediminis]|uniref:HisA/HisF-related TIM barrel protein n=1 Tax=Mesoterricola sediminis TaxID=2927980 RepID=UPI001FAF1A60|nr:HisA/HisF-related TIM barrel protein [Mesoterricola sediminis]